MLCKKSVSQACELEFNIFAKVYMNCSMPCEWNLKVEIYEKASYKCAWACARVCMSAWIFNARDTESKNVE